MKLEGGCLCGRLRYTIDAEPIDAGFCHCTLCQRASGAPTVAWVTVPFSGFHYTKGTAAAFASSALCQREFCSHCGTQIAFRVAADPRQIDITLCSLDDSAAIAPQYHIWSASQAPWLHIDDGLPQYPDAGPDSY